MIDIKDLQESVYGNTLFLGYTVNKKETIKKLREEIRELKRAKRCNKLNAPKIASMIDSDKDFKHFYEMYIKDTVHDELPDFVFIVMSYCQHYGIDLETDLLNKERYNKLRNKFI